MIEKALAADPADRYQSCAEMADALRGRAGVTSSGPRAPAAVPHEPPSFTPPKSSTNLAVWLALAGLLAIGVVLFVVKPGGDDTEDEVRPPRADDLAVYRKELGLGAGELTAQIETSLGTLHCRLAPDKAPLAVANFVGLASGIKPWRDRAGAIRRNSPYYDGTAIYRVIPEFVIQIGRPATSIEEPSDPGYLFADETNDLTHVPGTLAMASRGPATNGGELVLLVEEAKRLDGTETIIGTCAELDVLRKLSRVARDHSDHPETPLAIQRIRITKVE
ncbi:MAG: peptidylprolyl isomerase [Myxococcales bacterium]|nr:peptidylprolyl isomerase [Myxococcales bacterium]